MRGGLSSVAVASSYACMRGWRPTTGLLETGRSRLAAIAALLTTRQDDLILPISKVLSCTVLMDKQGVGMDMWKSLKMPSLATYPPLLPVLTHNGSAFGLTRFAC